MKLTDQQLVEALAENGHEPEAEALAEKLAQLPADNTAPVDMNTWIKGKTSPARTTRPAA